MDKITKFERSWRLHMRDGWSQVSRRIEGTSCLSGKDSCVCSLLQVIKGNLRPTNSGGRSLLCEWPHLKRLMWRKSCDSHGTNLSWITIWCTKYELTSISIALELSKYGGVWKYIHHSFPIRLYIKSLLIHFGDGVSVARWWMAAQHQDLV